MPFSQVDFLIVGQGLAGSILAFELIARGQRVLVIDNGHHGSASKVAAGIINPITGHRLNLTKGFVDYHHRATRFYAGLEREFDAKIIKDIDQVRLIKNPGQAEYFEKRLQQGGYKNFLEENSSSNLFKSAEYGTARIKQTSIVDTKALLKRMKAWLDTRSSYLHESIDYSQLRFSDNGVEYGAFRAGKVIFCEGYQAIYNPWLKDLPFKLANGEILSVEFSANDRAMLSWGNWLIADKEKTAKLGSNYAWQSTTLTPSEDVREKLLESLENQTGLKPTVIGHEVGVRPTTTDRHAFVGSITNREHAVCFNGFGSKGCLTIPAHADLLSDHLLNQSQLPEDLTKWL